MSEAEPSNPASPVTTAAAEPLLARAAFYLAFGSALSILFSIAVSQILLALAFAVLLLSGVKLRFPPVALPLGLFLSGTVVSLILSEDPAAGRPQIRKFFVFLALLVVFSTFRRLGQVRALMLAWAGGAALAAALALAQFLGKLRAARHAGRSFYDFYIQERITGFMSHWMTFGEQQMIVLLLLGAFLFFSSGARGKALRFAVACAAALAAAVLLGLTRSVWLGVGLAGMYLVWFWRRRWLLLAPVLLGAALWLGPQSLRTRFVSVFQPREQVDSNEHRVVCWVTGWEIVKAHPWFGLGPELVKKRFLDYVPPYVARPLPTGWYGHLHNIYIHYAAERGIPTMLFLMWVLAKVLLDFRKALRRLPPGRAEPRFVLHGAIAVVLSILVSGIFELNLGDSEVLLMFLVVVACGYVAAEAAESKEEPVG